MKSLLANFPGRKPLATIALLVATAVASRAQTTMYSATTGNASTQATTSYAQQLTLSGGATNRYSISGMTLSLYQVGTTTTSYLYLDFYTGANTSPTAVDALDNATYITTQSFQIAGQSVAGSYTYPLTFSTPITLNTGTFFVDVALTDTSLNYQSTSVIEGNFNLTTPTVGTSPGFVWDDTNRDGTFAGSEQTKFGGTTASIRMTFNASIVPEPGTNAALACGGLVLLGGWQLRRRSRARA